MFPRKHNFTCALDEDICITFFIKSIYYFLEKNSSNYFLWRSAVPVGPAQESKGFPEGQLRLFAENYTIKKQNVSNKILKNLNTHF